MPLLKGRYREQSRMDEEVYILYVILKSLISVSMCVSVLNERRSSQYTDATIGDTTWKPDLQNKGSQLAC